MADVMSRSTAAFSSLTVKSSSSSLPPSRRRCCNSRSIRIGSSSSGTRLLFLPPPPSSSPSWSRITTRCIRIIGSDFHRLNVVADLNGPGQFQLTASQSQQLPRRLGIAKVHKWWEKGLQHNMKEITSAQGLVDSLSDAGDKLVVVDFFSPGCGGCKALHPKICQLAELNPDVQFLQVNYEEHKSMCYSLNVHVLPFFRFYRGAEGRVCSFSCTNATISKFKNALAKHNTPRCTLGPPRGLEEKELLALASNRDLSFNYKLKSREPEKAPLEQEPVLEAVADKLLLPLAVQNLHQDSGENSLVAAGR